MLTWRPGCPRARGMRWSAGSSARRWPRAGPSAINWGGLDGCTPSGSSATLIALAVSPPLGALGGFVVIRAVRRLARRATRRWHAPVGGGEWVMSAALAFSHGANDAQKSVGVIAALLLADGRSRHLAAPTWVDRRLRRGADRRHGARRMADHSHRGPAHLPDPAARRPREPEASAGVILGASVDRRADVDDAGRRLLDRRRRWRPPPLAARALGGRSPDGARLARHAAGDRGARGGRSSRLAGG